MMRRLIREPLVHFLLLAALIFLAYGLFENRPGSEDTIVVTQARIAQLASVFTRTRQRPPTADELNGLIDDYVTEEVYVREATRLGIDRGDAVIRRRLQTKMEFLADAEAEATPPTDNDLQTYLTAHPDQFREPASTAFEQVYLNPQRRGTRTQVDAKALLASLTRGEALAATAGDPTLLPAALALTEQQGIAAVFGDDFAAAVVTLAPGTWQGPIASAIGLHLVKVTDRVPGRLPPLSEIRPEVEREWVNKRRTALSRQKFEDLLKRYKVSIEMPLAPANASQ